MFKYTGNLNTDIFADFSSMQASSRIEELETVIKQDISDEVKTKIYQSLVARIESNYKHNSETFKKMKTPEKVRDFLIAFGRHWISGICYDSQPIIYKIIPASFKNGKF